MTHVVTAPLIVVVANGERHSLYTGAIIPSGVKSEDISRLSREGYIREAEHVAAPVADEGETPREPSDIPAKDGPGSGKARWADYADSLGVEVPDGAGRDVIIQAIAEAGHPTE